MRVAVLADLHGNVWALESVLADAASLGAQRIINLGDICYGPLAPRAAFDRVMAVSDIVVRGNQDRMLFEATAVQRAANPTLAYVLDDLGLERVSRLHALPETVETEDGLFLCHGTPRRDDAYFLEDVASGTARPRAAEAVADEAEGIAQAMILCGHTHIPRIVPLADGRTVVNPGSAGLPAYDDDLPVPHAMETGDSDAAYALLTLESGRWTATLRRVAYDVEAAVAAAKANGRDDWAGFLATGRVRG